jgi:outer membrane protein OmpA-like peptidoglycan-associated protein
LVILAVTVAASVALDQWGRSLQPLEYTVPFERGTTLADSAPAVIDRAAGRLVRNPNYEIVVEGHSGTLGDAEANRDLSRLRAERVEEALLDSGIAPDRIRLLAVGGSEPLAREEEESDAAFQRRLGRVELILVPQ